MVFLDITHEQGPAEDMAVTILTTIKAVMKVQIKGDNLELFPYLSFVLFSSNTSRFYSTSQLVVHTHYTAS